MMQMRERSAVPDAEKAITHAGESAQRIMEQALRSFKPTESQREAHVIMGPRVIGVRDGMEHCGIVFQKEHLGALADVSFHSDLLRQAALEQSGILIAMPQISIIDFQMMVEPELFAEPLETAWYREHAFARQKAGIPFPCWHLINTEPLQKSAGKRSKEQCFTLSKDEMLAGAMEIIYASIVYHQKTGERLFQEWVRTANALTQRIEKTHERTWVTFRFGEGGIEFGKCPESTPPSKFPPIISEIKPPQGIAAFDGRH